MKHLVSTTLMVLLALATSARADSWSAAQVREQSSPDGQFTVRVTPGDSLGDVFGFAGSPKGKYATAEWFRSAGGSREKLHTITLLNPVAPVEFLVTDSGALLTLDNWHKVGYGKMLVVYSPAGAVLKQYSLGELYSYRDIRRFGMSTSSILWRCNSGAPLALKSSTELWLDDNIGGRIVVNADTGSFEYQRNASACKQEPSAQLTSVVPDRVKALPWGEEADGLRVNVDLGNVTGPLPYGNRLNLELYVWIRNDSSEPVPVDMLDGATYDFEYEIDGRWYAFDQLAPLRTSNSITRATLVTRARQQFLAQARDSDLWVAIAPGAATTTFLNVPLLSPSPTLQLHEITASGPGRRFEARPGPHTLRVRARGVLEPERQAPVSNTITFTLKTLPAVETRTQEISFASSQNAPRNLRFVSEPAGGQALIRQALARPPQPGNAPLVIQASALQVLQPLRIYELRLSRDAGAPNQILPAPYANYRYLVRSEGLVAAIVDLAVHTDGPHASPDGPLFVSINSTASSELPFAALETLAAMKEIAEGSYEPRMLQVSGDQGMGTLQVVWLHSLSGGPDIFYLPHDPGYRGTTKVERGKLYTPEDFLAAARAL